MAASCAGADAVRACERLRDPATARNRGQDMPHVAPGLRSSCLPHLLVVARQAPLAHAVVVRVGRLGGNSIWRRGRHAGKHWVSCNNPLWFAPAARGGVASATHAAQPGRAQLPGRAARWVRSGRVQHEGRRAQVTLTHPGASGQQAAPLLRARADSRRARSPGAAPACRTCAVRPRGVEPPWNARRGGPHRGARRRLSRATPQHSRLTRAAGRRCVAATAL